MLLLDWTPWASEQQTCQYVHGLALKLMEWIDEHYLIMDDKDKVIKDYAFSCPHSFAAVLFSYKEVVEVHPDMDITGASKLYILVPEGSDSIPLWTQFHTQLLTLHYWSFLCGI